jgi:AraC-like DNA-binding protein
MNNRYKIIIAILLAVISVSSLAALFFFPYKLLSAVLLAISALGLFVYYLFSGDQTQEVGSKKYSDILIIDELDRFFQKNKPYLDANYKIPDLEKQLKVSRSAISSFTKHKYRRNFNQYLNLWRIAEIQRLQSLPENGNINISILCQKAGFSNAQQYYEAEKERKAINRKKNINKSVVEKTASQIINDPEIKKKPEIHIRT